MGRFATAWKAFWSILGSRDISEEWKQFRAASPRPRTEGVEEQPAGLTAGEAHADAVYTLALLQREGRLIDFLTEDISSYDNAQIGAAVRQIHAKCKTALEEHFAIEPIQPDDEGSAVEIPAGFDPRSVRIVGNPTAPPPFKGTLKHRGWKAAKVDLPQRNEALDPTVICPAEVEV